MKSKKKTNSATAGDKSTTKRKRRRFNKMDNEGCGSSLVPWCYPVFPTFFPSTFLFFKIIHIINTNFSLPNEIQNSSIHFVAMDKETI